MTWKTHKELSSQTSTFTKKAENIAQFTDQLQVVHNILKLHSILTDTVPQCSEKLKTMTSKSNISSTKILKFRSSFFGTRNPALSA